MFGLASHWAAAKYKLQSVVEEDIYSKLPKGKYTPHLESFNPTDQVSTYEYTKLSLDFQNTQYCSQQVHAQAPGERNNMQVHYSGVSLGLHAGGKSRL